MRFQQIAACPDLRATSKAIGAVGWVRRRTAACRLRPSNMSRTGSGPMRTVWRSSWYRMPDYGGDYRAQWALCARLSDRQTPHVDLVSVWRLVRDETYAGCLSSRSAARPSAGRFRVLCTRAPAPGKRAVLRRLADARGSRPDTGLACDAHAHAPSQGQSGGGGQPEQSLCDLAASHGQPAPVSTG